MATSARAADTERYDVRTMVGGGIILGALTAVGVVIFALVSRAVDGTVETIIQSILILAGGGLVTYFPAASVRPRSVDAIAWAATLGLLGSVAFTVFDTAVLRPLHVYHWTWDAIGGGSGFWYISVWWMGSAVVAWLGAWAYARVVGRSKAVSVPSLLGQTITSAVLLFAVLVVIGLVPFHSASMGLAFALALLAQVPLATVLAGR